MRLSKAYPHPQQQQQQQQQTSQFFQPNNSYGEYCFLLMH